VEHDTHTKPSIVQHGTVGSSTRSASVSYGRRDSVNCDEEDVISNAKEKRQQIDLELQDKIHALAEGLL